MSRRMMCTLCFETAEPDTVVEGSDLAEMFGWLCFAVPGWLYCLWRHALRSRACPSCGGASLIREARAAQARFAPPSIPARVRSASGASRWPRALAHPRDRLLHGGIAAAAWIACVPIGLRWVGPHAAGFVAALLAVLGVGWSAFEINRVLRMRSPACSAWDDSGRKLQIELV